MDLNVDNYTTEELTELLGIEELSDTAIKEAVRQQKEEHPSRKSVAFFQAIQDKLLKVIEEQPVAKVVEVEIKKGTINPDLKTTLTRLINIDSSYRNKLTPPNVSDNYVLELTEPLLNVVSLALYSIELPQAWYTIAQSKGTNSFILYVLDTTDQVSIQAAKHILISIPEGNYTTEDICTTFIRLVNENMPKNSAGVQDLQLASFLESYNHNTGVLTLKVKSAGNKRKNVIQFMWMYAKSIYPEMLNNRYNYNLGWLLGFRSPLTTCTLQETTVLDSGTPVTETLYTHTAESLVDVSGTKYIILSLDDYKTNRLNRNIVSVNNAPNVSLALPKYFSEDIPMHNLHVLPSKPRKLTSKQLYTINAITDQTIPSNLIMGHESSNAFAKIAVKRTDWGKTGNGVTLILDIPNKLFVENGGPLQQQVREYFGPVDIFYLQVALYDDKGNALGMNGMDWSFSLLAKCIYQY